ncbi:MAG TPA: hypothetical protein VNI56_01000 [Xanthomonadaceae bacterium]|nr:hypothetical protein [Xanthomonadaceae bacterium]
MATSKSTGNKAATAASKTLRSKDTAKASKSAAGSALAQASTRKSTGDKAATAASKTLRDGRTAKASKSAAGSALAQAKAGKAKAKR